MIEFSDHARKAMQDDDISEEEVESCLKHGELEIKQIVNGEMRYGKQIELKDKLDCGLLISNATPHLR